MSAVIPFSAACERNKDPILEVISPYLQNVNEVLEIGSGTGQHAVYFAQALPHLNWQSSDQACYLEGIHAQFGRASLNNLLAPIELDVTQSVWFADERRFSAIFTANTFHIMTKSQVVAFFDGVGSVSTESALLLVYGPFKYRGDFTSVSNQVFDQSLRARNCGSAIRDIEWIEELAREAGFGLQRDIAMPANNQLLVLNRIGCE
jgi:cyclopropane fatty-acyl-phospholipid synthase-like methyltransferase